MVQTPRHWSRPLPDPVQVSLELIEADLSESLTIKQIASEVGLSPYHFQRKFAQDIGETVAGYIRSRRLEHGAKSLLTADHKALIDVAVECGFQTHSSFTRAFGRHFGMTPKEFAAGGSKRLEPSVDRSRPFLKPVATTELALTVDTLPMPELWLMTRQQTGSTNGSFFAAPASLANGLEDLLAENHPDLLSVCGAFQTGPKEFSDPKAIARYGGLFGQRPTSEWGELHQRIPSGLWAAIPHVGRLDKLHMTWNKALRSWLPSSEFSLRSEWMFELYYASADDSDRKFLTAQVLLPIEHAGQDRTNGTT